MKSNEIFKPKSDEEIYMELVNREPNHENLLIIFQMKKTHLLKRLISDIDVNEEKRVLWKKIVDNHKKDIDRTLF